MNTGRPCLGSWASYGLGSMNQNLPTFVVLVARATHTEQVQAISALKSYLTLNPADHGVHQRLGDIYRHIYYLDVAREHYEQALRYLPRARPPASAKKEVLDQYVQNKKYLEGWVGHLEQVVKARKKDFDARAPLKEIGTSHWAAV